MKELVDVHAAAMTSKDDQQAAAIVQMAGQHTAAMERQVLLAQTGAQSSEMAGRLLMNTPGEPGDGAPLASLATMPALTGRKITSASSPGAASNSAKPRRRMG